MAELGFVLVTNGRVRATFATKVDLWLTFVAKWRGNTEKQERATLTCFTFSLLPLLAAGFSVSLLCVLGFSVPRPQCLICRCMPPGFHILSCRNPSPILFRNRAETEWTDIVDTGLALRIFFPLEVFAAYNLLSFHGLSILLHHFHSTSV